MASRSALMAAHSPAARKKAVQSATHLAGLRQKLAAKYDSGSNDFTKPHLLATVKRLGISLGDIPEDLFKPFGVKIRKQLLAQRAMNGHAREAGVGIPLDAIPERKKNSVSASTKGASAKARNVELIGKIVDLLAKPETTDTIAERLTRVLDKLI